MPRRPELDIEAFRSAWLQIACSSRIDVCLIVHFYRLLPAAGSSILVDLDNFKLVNDTYGHPVGDKLLNVVATRLKSCVGETGAVARVGGDEFAVILEDVSTSDKVRRVAQAMLSATCETFILDGHQIACSTSVGAALKSPCDGNTRK